MMGVLNLRRGAALLGLCLLAMSSRTRADELASTSTAAVKTKPKASTTTFKRGYFDSVANQDRVRIAEHELVHAIGFFKGLKLFDDHIVNNAGTLEFRTDPKDAKTNVATILSTSSHIDPDFKADLMNPNPEIRSRVSDLDKTILNAAYDWTGSGGLDITIKFAGTWDDDEKKSVMMDAETARSDIYKKFNGEDKAGKNAFTWTLKAEAVPEASTVVQMALATVAGAACIGFGRRRRRAARSQEQNAPGNTHSA